MSKLEELEKKIEQITKDLIRCDSNWGSLYSYHNERIEKIERQLKRIIELEKKIKK